MDIRIIAATNRDLMQRVDIKAFRLDLFYRLNVLHLRTPALRDHPEDIGALFDCFLRQYSQEYRMPMPRLTSDALCDLSRWEWPGECPRAQERGRAARCSRVRSPRHSL